MRKLPFMYDVDDSLILKELIKANNKIGELNGMLKVLPNPKIILNAIIIGEAKESSEIENIVTTYDQLFKEMTMVSENKNSKEVLRYRQAILYGFEILKEKDMLTTNMIESIHKIIEPNIGGIRKLPGTVIMNTKTKEVLHNPPQLESEIREYLSNLENYINDFNDDTNPIIKMALSHYQFEAIHPFHDGNGRVGRLLNVLYLVYSKLIDLPILYLSKYINANREEYYNHLNNITKSEDYIKDYLIYMIKGVYYMSDYTIRFINNFIDKMNLVTDIVKSSELKIYSLELINYLFYDFYTKNTFLREELNISRNTASKYLKELVNLGILEEEKVGKEIIYKNIHLYNLMNDW